MITTMSKTFDTVLLTFEGEPPTHDEVTEAVISSYGRMTDWCTIMNCTVLVTLCRDEIGETE